MTTVATIPTLLTGYIYGLNPGDMTSLSFDCKPIISNTAMMAANGTFTSAVSPIVGSPAQLTAAANRNTIELANPTDGTLFYVGVDATLAPDTGNGLYPGNRIIVSGYIGPIWTVSAGAATTFYYKTT